jgi:DNA-binding transcriptional ArsR family regulator
LGDGAIPLISHSDSDSSLRRVFLTDGQRETEAIKILTGADALAALHALADESRRRILHALRARRMSTSELVEFLDKQEPDKEFKPQTVRYHLKELERCGLIQQDGYEPSGNGGSHIMTKLWRATAESVFIATETTRITPEKGEPSIERSMDIVETLKRLGFDISSKETLDETAKVFTEWEQLWSKGRSRAQEILKGVSEIDPDVYVTLKRVLSVISLADGDYERYWEVSHRVSDLLRNAYHAGGNPDVY